MHVKLSKFSLNRESRPDPGSWLYMLILNELTIIYESAHKTNKIQEYENRLEQDLIHIQTPVTKGKSGEKRQ